MTPRAPALPPDDRRAALIAATIPLLREHGRAVTTRQIAQAAEVAEGTIFRVFETKDALVDAALVEAMDPGDFHDELRALGSSTRLRDNVIAIVAAMQERLRSIFALMDAVGIIGPPPAHEDEADRHAEFFAVVADLLAPHRAELRLDPLVVAHLLRLQTFTACHPAVADDLHLGPEEIADLVLYGVAADTPALAAPTLARATTRRPRKAC
ncbi:TetR/AcrR family transcriptional regulator [Actinomycetota bacterium]